MMMMKRKTLDYYTDKLEQTTDVLCITHHCNGMLLRMTKK